MPTRSEKRSEMGNTPQDAISWDTLCFLSFRFSQGVQPIQMFIFRWLSQHLHSTELDLHCDSEWRQDFIGPSLGFIRSGKNHKQAHLPPNSGLTQDVDAMVDILQNGSVFFPERFTAEKLVEKISFGMIDADSKYLLDEVQNGTLRISRDWTSPHIDGRDDDFNLGVGRPGRKIKVMAPGEPLAASSFFSYAAGYVLTGRTSGSPAYDALLNAVHDRLCILRDSGPQSREDDVSSILLARLINVHCHFHPFDIENISPEWHSFANKNRGGELVLPER